MKRITVGRASDNDIIFDVQSISNYHADVVISNDRVTITDHSTNGTWVNGKKLHNDSCEIREGDKILLPGNVSLDWRLLVKDSKKTQRWNPNSTTPASKHPSEEDYHRPRQHQPHNEYPQYVDDGNYTVKTLAFGDAISNIFSHYADFSGRARRSEYWWFVLLNAILTCIPYVGIIWMLAAMIPGLSVAVRRLHDIGKSGWFLLLGLIPLVGGILLIIWFCQDSQSSKNEYGVSPKYRNNPHAFKKYNWT